MDNRAKPYYYLSAADIENDTVRMEVSVNGTKDDVAKFLISILCRTKGKNTLKNIADKKYQPLTRLGIQNRDELREFCEAYPQCFILSKQSSNTNPSSSASYNDEPEVEVTTDIRICMRHVKRARSCPDDAECGCLHICKFFILSGKCEFSSKKHCFCSFGHNLWSDHNHSVLKRHLMDHLTRRELTTLLRRRNTRTLQTRPTLCRYYNNSGGCAKGIRCGALHVCKRFIFGDCKFGDKCNRNHDLLEPSVIFILDQYEIGAEDVTELMWDNEHEMNSRPQPSPSSYHVSSNPTAWGAPARIPRHGASSPLRAGNRSPQPWSGRDCLTFHSKSTARSPRARNRDSSSRSRRGSSSSSSRGPRSAKDRESSRGLFSPLSKDKVSPRGLLSSPSKDRESPRGLLSPPSKDRESPRGLLSPPSKDRESSKGLLSSPSKDRESPTGLLSPPSKEVSKNSNTKSDTDRNSPKEKTAKIADMSELKVHQTLFPQRQGHIVAEFDEKKDIDTKQVEEDSELFEGKGDHCISLNPFSSVSNPPRSSTVDSDLSGSVVASVPKGHVKDFVNQVNQAQRTPTDIAVANLSVDTNSTNAEGNYSDKKASDGILFGRKKDLSWVAPKFSDKHLAENPTAVRPVASVTPQVKPKPDVGCLGTEGVPKASEDLLFGSKKKAEEVVDENKCSPRMKEAAKPYPSVNDLSNSSSALPSEPTPSSSSLHTSSSPVASNLQSIIANLISNVQKLHSQNPQATGPEAHFVSYLSELAQPDKFKAEIKTKEEKTQPDKFKAEIKTNEEKTQPDKPKEEVKTIEEMDNSSGETGGDEGMEKWRYLSDGEITDSDHEEAVNSATADAATQEKMLFEYNHLPAVNMIGHESSAIKNVGVGEADPANYPETLNTQMDGQEVAGSTARPETSSSERKRERLHLLRSERTKSCSSKLGKSSSRRKHRSVRKKSTGLEYEAVDSPEEELELIDSSEDDMSDILSSDEDSQLSSVGISANRVQGDGTQMKIENGNDINGNLMHSHTISSSQFHSTQQGVDSSEERDVHSQLSGRSSYRGECVSHRSLSPFRSMPVENVSSEEMTAQLQTGRVRSPGSRRGNLDPRRSPCCPRRSSPGQQRPAAHPGRSSPNPKTIPSQTGRHYQERREGCSPFEGRHSSCFNQQSQKRGHTSSPLPFSDMECGEGNRGSSSLLHTSSPYRNRSPVARHSLSPHRHTNGSFESQFPSGDRLGDMCPGTLGEGAESSQRPTGRCENVWNDRMYRRGDNRSRSQERRACSLDGSAISNDCGPREHSAGSHFQGVGLESMRQMHPSRKPFDTRSRGSSFEAFSQHVMDDTTGMRGQQRGHGNESGSFRSRQGSFNSSFRESDRRGRDNISVENLKVQERSADGTSRGNSLDRQHRPGSSPDGRMLTESRQEFYNDRQDLYFEDFFKEGGLDMGTTGSPFQKDPSCERKPFSEEVFADNYPHRSAKRGHARLWRGRGLQGKQNKTPRRFPNYEAWRRAQGESSEDNLNSSLTEPEVVLKYRSISDNEEMTGEQIQPQMQNHGDLMEMDLHSMEQFMPKHRDQIPEHGPPRHFLDEEFNRFEERNQHRVGERYGQFGDSPQHHRNHCTDQGASGQSHSHSPGRLYRDKSQDFAALERSRNSGFGRTGWREESRNSFGFRRQKSGGFDSVSADHDELSLREHIHDLLGKARCGWPGPSPPRNFPGNSSSSHGQSLPVEREIHEQGNSSFLRLSPDPLCRDVLPQKRIAEDQYHNHSGPSKKGRASSPREHYRRTNPSEHNRYGHRQSCRHPSTRRRSRSRDDKHREDADANRNRGNTYSGRDGRGRGRSRGRGSDQSRYHPEPHGHSFEEKRGRTHLPPNDNQVPSRRFREISSQVELKGSSFHLGDHYQDLRRKDAEGKLTNESGFKIKKKLNKVQPPFKNSSGYEANWFGELEDGPVEQVNREFDESLPPYLDLDRPQLEDGVDTVLFDQHCDDGGYDGEGVDSGLFGQQFVDDGYGEEFDNLNFQSWGNGFGENFDEPDVDPGRAGNPGFEDSYNNTGDMTCAERGRAGRLDLRNILRNRVRSRMLKEAKAERLQIRVNRGSGRRGAQKGKRVDENGREVTMAGRH